MYLEAEESFATVVVDEVGTWYGVNPCFNDVSFGVDCDAIPIEMINDSCASGGVAFRFREWVFPAIHRLAEDTASPATLVLVHFTLVAKNAFDGGVAFHFLEILAFEVA